MAYKIAVVGGKDIVTAFQLIGFDVYPSYTAEETRRTIDKLAKEDYGIIYLTEELADLIPETIRRYDALPTPSITLIPTNRGSLGIGSDRINDNVEKAIGSNILQGGD